MRVIIADTRHKILCTIQDSSIRIPVKGDYVCYHDQSSKTIVYEEEVIRDGIVEKVMIDYVQDVAIVTLKDEFKQL